MTVQSVDTADAEQFFTIIRDTDFGWTVAEIPSLMRSLGWTIGTEIVGQGAVAHTPWGIPEADAELLYEGTVVQSVTTHLTNRASEERSDNLAVAEAFVRLTTSASRVLGTATRTIPGELPRTQWRLAIATATIQNVGVGVLIDWCRNEYQDFNDSVGRY